LCRCLTRCATVLSSAKFLEWGALFTNDGIVRTSRGNSPLRTRSAINGLGVSISPNAGDNIRRVSWNASSATLSASSKSRNIESCLTQTKTFDLEGFESCLLFFLPGRWQHHQHCVVLRMMIWPSHSTKVSRDAMEFVLSTHHAMTVHLLVVVGRQRVPNCACNLEEVAPFSQNFLSFGNSNSAQHKNRPPHFFLSTNDYRKSITLSFAHWCQWPKQNCSFFINKSQRRAPISILILPAHLSSAKILQKEFMEIIPVVRRQKSP